VHALAGGDVDGWSFLYAKYPPPKIITAETARITSSNVKPLFFVNPIMVIKIEEAYNLPNYFIE
jgi:hypothetical protein